MTDLTTSRPYQIALEAITLNDLDQAVDFFRRIKTVPHELAIPLNSLMVLCALFSESVEDSIYTDDNLEILMDTYTRASELPNFENIRPTLNQIITNRLTALPKATPVIQAFLQLVQA